MHNGPRRGGNPMDKPKDFKGTIKRQLVELSSYWPLIVLSLLLAFLGSILSIFAPNKLKDLTNEISAGLVINTKNMEELTSKIQSNASEDNISKRVTDILDLKLNEEVIASVLGSDTIKSSDKEKFSAFLKNHDGLKELPLSVLNVIMPSSTYKGVVISTTDKLALLDIGTDFSKLPDSVKGVLFDDILVDGVTISSSEQVDVLVVLSSLNSDESDVYAKIEELPDDVVKLVEPVMNMSKIKNISLFLAILYICSATFTYIESISMTIVSNKFAQKLRGKVSKKINRIPLKFFDNHQTGDLLSRVTNDIDTVAQSMNQSLATLVSAVTLFLGTLVMMFITNWLMATGRYGNHIHNS